MAGSATERILDRVQGRCPRLPRNAAAQCFRTALSRLAQDTESWRCRIPLSVPAARCSLPVTTPADWGGEGVSTALSVTFPAPVHRVVYGRECTIRDTAGREICRAVRYDNDIVPLFPSLLAASSNYVAEIPVTLISLVLPPLRVNARYGRVVLLREAGGRPLCRAHRNGAELHTAEPWRIPSGAEVVAEVSLYPSEEGPCDMPDEVLEDLAPAVTEYAVHLAASTAHSAWTDAATASEAYARYAREVSRILVTVARETTGMHVRTALPIIERNA